MERLRKAQSRGMLAAVMLLAAFFALVEPAAAASCTWGGTPSVGAPLVTFLRADQGPFRSPSNIAIDPISGRRYITDPGKNRVLVRDAAGRLQFVKDGFNIPLGMAVDGSGKVYVGEKGTGSVTVFDAYLNDLYKIGAGNGEFLAPNAIAIDPDPAIGRIYVGDSWAHTIKVYPSGGTPILPIVWKDELGDPFDFDLPVGVYVNAMGEVFVADRNNDRIAVFTRDGTFLRCFGGRGGSFSQRRFGMLTAGITGDSQDRLYVADGFQGHVKVFDRLGVIITTLGSFGEGSDQFKTPIGLAIDPFNRLFVTSANTGLVPYFGLDSFSDPFVVQAVVDVKRDRLNRFSMKKSIAVYIEVPGYSVEGVAGVTANGVSALSSPWAIGDYDDDEIPDLKVKFNKDALLATLPDGEAIVRVSGQFTNGDGFEGVDTVRVISKVKARRLKARKLKARKGKARRVKARKVKSKSARK